MAMGIFSYDGMGANTKWRLGVPIHQTVSQNRSTPQGLYKKCTFSAECLDFGGSGRAGFGDDLRGRSGVVYGVV